MRLFHYEHGKIQLFISNGEKIPQAGKVKTVPYINACPQHLIAKTDFYRVINSDK